MPVGAYDKIRLSNAVGFYRLGKTAYADNRICQGWTGIDKLRQNTRGALSRAERRGFLLCRTHVCVEPHLRVYKYVGCCTRGKGEKRLFIKKLDIILQKLYNEKNVKYGECV